MWTCPKCNKAFRFRGQEHSCVVVPLASHFPPGREDARRVFDGLHALVRSYDPSTRLSIARTRIGFINGITFAAVNRVRADGLDLHLLLERRDEGGFAWTRREVLGGTTVHHARVTMTTLADRAFQAALRESVQYGRRSEWATEERPEE